MVMTIQELQTSNATDYDTTNISGTQGQIWLDKVVEYANTLKRFDQAALIYNDLVGTANKTLTIPKTTSELDITTGTSQNAAPTYTELTNLNTVNLTIDQDAWKRGGVAIAKQILMTSRVDLLKQARSIVANAMANDVDQDLRTEMADTSTYGNQGTNYGGDATSTGELTDGDVITPDLVADAMADIESNKFKAQGGRLFIAPEQLKAFRKDSQFVNAAEYGSDAVIERGEVGNYLGVKVITTNNVASGSYGSGGHDCILAGVNKEGENVTAALGWKEKPQVGYEFHKEKAEHRVYYNQAYDVAVIHDKALSLIYVTDA